MQQAANRAKDRSGGEVAAEAITCCTLPTAVVIRDTTDSLSRACWSLADMLFSLRQSKRGGKACRRRLRVAAVCSRRRNQISTLKLSTSYFQLRPSPSIYAPLPARLHA